MANKWHACLALERDLAAQSEQHSAALTEQRVKWNAALDDLEVCVRVSRAPGVLTGGARLTISAD